MATIPNLQADFMNRYTSEVPPMPGLMGGLAREGGGGRTGGIGLVQNRSVSQWSGGAGDVGGGVDPGGVAPTSQAQVNPLSFGAGTIGGGLSGPGATGDLAGDLDAGIPGHHSAEEYGGIIGDIHSGLQGALGYGINAGLTGPMSQAAAYSQQGPKDKTGIDKPGTFSAMTAPMGFGVFGGTPFSGVLGLVGTLADKLGFGFSPAIAGEDLGGYGLGEGFGDVAGVAGVSGFGSEGGSYGEGYGGGYGGTGGLSGDMGGFGEGSIGSGNSQGGGDMGDGGSTW